MEQILPKHIAIIMDGNRRWAKQRGLEGKLGHKQGADTLEKIVKYANKIGIKYITVYAFSTENWKRAEDEVGALMLLLQSYLDSFFKNTTLILYDSTYYLVLFTSSIDKILLQPFFSYITEFANLCYTSDLFLNKLLEHGEKIIPNDAIGIGIRYFG